MRKEFEILDKLGMRIHAVFKCKKCRQDFADEEDRSCIPNICVTCWNYYPQGWKQRIWDEHLFKNILKRKKLSPIKYKNQTGDDYVP